ncbi:hypothetical protein Tco_1235260 [Tanacetum coccineum]
MITDEMKLTDNYRMYATVFGVDVPTTQSQPIEFTQGTRTTSTPRSPNPNVDEGESNVQKVEEHLIAEEIKKLVEGSKNVENVEVDSSTLRQNDPDTRLEPKSNKESPEVEITAEVKPVNINKEEEESTEDDYELKRMEKGKNESTVNNPPPSSSTPSSSSPKFKLSATNQLLSLCKPKTRRFKRYKSFFDELQECYSYLFEHLKTRFMSRKKFNVLAQHLQEIMEESLPKMVDDRVNELTKTHVPEVDINKKTENRAKMTKLSMKWKRLCKIKAKDQKCQSQSQYRRISSQTGARTEEYYWMQS